MDDQEVVSFVTRSRTYTTVAYLLLPIEKTVYRANPSKVFAHHFMLTHRASAIKSSAIKWTFPRVMKTSEPNVRESNARTPSTTSRNVGLRDEPGSRMLEKKSLSDGDAR